MTEKPNPRAVIGANNPPSDDPLDAFAVHIGDLFDEAQHFLDGAGVNSQAEADAVGRLMDLLRTAGRDADKARAAEKKPHDDAAKAVQARWKPLIDKADLAVSTCKKALAPYLQRIADEQRAREEAARAEAEAKARAAAEAVRAAAHDDLAAQEAAQAAEAEAKAAEREAKRAANARPQAAGGARAATLRTYYRPELVNANEALRHFIAIRPDDVKAALQRLAEIEVQNGARSIPGFNIIAEERVV